MMGDDGPFLCGKGKHIVFFFSLPPAEREEGPPFVFLRMLADRSAGKSGSLAHEHPRSHACH